MTDKNVGCVFVSTPFADDTTKKYLCEEGKQHLYAAQVALFHSNLILSNLNKRHFMSCIAVLAYEAAVIQFNEGQTTYRITVGTERLVTADEDHLLAEACSWLKDDDRAKFEELDVLQARDKALRGKGFIK